MYVKSSLPQQDAVAETWTADFLVLGQALYHWATLPPTKCFNNIFLNVEFSIQLYIKCGYDQNQWEEV